MRVLCFSDAQLGSGAGYGREPGGRLREQADALQVIAGAVAEHACDLVLFCGDAFQHRRPSAAELVVWRQFLDAAGDVVALPGNHDTTGPDQPTTLDVFKGHPHFYCSSTPKVWRPSGSADLACLPWAHPGTERAKLGAAGSPAETAERLVQVAAGLRAQCGPHAVLALHWALTECSLPGGLPTSALTEPVVPLEALRAQGWAYIVAGHIHKLQRPAPNVVVCGSPYVCDFGEAHLDHGYWIIDTHQVVEGVYADPFYCPLPGREFVTIDIDLTKAEAENWAPSYEDLEGAVVRVRYTATEQQAREVDQAALKRDLYAAGAHKVYAIEAIVQRSERPRMAGAHEHLEPLAALDMWLAGQDDEAEIHRAVAEQGARYIEEVR